jgi:hypothetical protein
MQGPEFPGVYMMVNFFDDKFSLNDRNSKRKLSGAAQRVRSTRAHDGGDHNHSYSFPLAVQTVWDVITFVTRAERFRLPIEKCRVIKLLTKAATS